MAPRIRVIEGGKSLKARQPEQPVFDEQIVGLEPDGAP